MNVHSGPGTDTGPIATPTTAEPGTADRKLVGRDSELSRIYRFLAGGRGGVVLVGGPGVGKTRLVREALRQAEQRGHATEALIPPRVGEPAPFAAFAHLFPSTRPPTNPNHVLGRLTKSLGIRPGGRRMVLAVDDAHLLDDASAGLLLQLAGTGNVFVVASLRRGEPISSAVTALWKEGHCERLDVRALDRADVEELTESVLGGPVSIPTSQFLWNTTHGNVLFLHEVVTAGLEGGAFTCSGRTWMWQGPLRVSARLADVVESGLGRLADGELAVLCTRSSGVGCSPRSATVAGWRCNWPTRSTGASCGSGRRYCGRARSGGSSAMRCWTPVRGGARIRCGWPPGGWSPATPHRRS